MTQIPADWYPDPDPAYAGRPGRLRYWDGQQWTEHVHEHQPAPPVAPAPPPSYPAYGDYAANPAYVNTGYANAGYATTAPSPYASPVATTPDGQPLSGWWRRVLAAILDGLISLPLLLLATVPVVASQWDELSTWVSDLSDAIDNDTPDPPDPALLDPTSAPGFALVMSMILATVLYHVVFLRWKQATPGKLIVGLRIRRREIPGALPWSTILTRVGFVAAISVVSQIPVPAIGLIGLLSLLDVLWPLWDRNNQALHDKVARTNVVLKQPAPTQPATAAGPPPRW